MKKPFLLLFNDIHVKDDNHELVISLINQILEVCKRLGIHIVVFNGDFFDSRLSQRLDNLMLFKYMINLFMSQGIMVYCTSGNHDKRNQYAELSYLSLFDNDHEGFSLFEKEGFVVHDNTVLCFIPYFPEKDEYLTRLDRLIDSVKKYEGKKKIVLFTHVSVSGVRNNDGSLVDNDVRPDYFSVFDKVFVAHYHNEQIVGDNIIYNGSTHQSNFGEDAKKGFTILYSDISHELIVSNFPKYRKLIFHATDLKKARRMAEKLSNGVDVIRFIFRGNSFELERINKIEFEEMGIDVKFENISETLVSFSSLDEIEIIKHDKKSLMKGWMDYCKEGDVESEIKTEVFKKMQKL